MSRHLPAVSGKQRGDFSVLRQKGSHVSMEKCSGESYWRTIVPMHREIRPGTLSDILNQTGLSKEELAELL
ncbi:MAG TPA: type II toxin-antitoxin system HicA family toxin [Verrucomicrobiae bacterium]|jgi:predicted RNA binding protein YcfA (HicA-like mRNA interferase family)|nr:type II toxin-antitoxin system HicA family toxin [Verrucomicrobiae bacterium]